MPPNEIELLATLVPPENVMARRAHHIRDALPPVKVTVTAAFCEPTEIGFVTVPVNVGAAVIVPLLANSNTKGLVIDKDANVNPASCIRKFNPVEVPES